jgi:hypothetical protein
MAAESGYSQPGRNHPGRRKRPGLWIPSGSLWGEPSNSVHHPFYGNYWSRGQTEMSVLRSLHHYWLINQRRRSYVAD